MEGSGAGSAIGAGVGAGTGIGIFVGASRAGEGVTISTGNCWDDTTGGSSIVPTDSSVMTGLSLVLTSVKRLFVGVKGD